MRRRQQLAPVEPPAWVRSFRPEEWAEPDEREEQMAEGGGFGDEHRRWHATRRWVAARNVWYDQHPEADDRLEELIGGSR